MQRIAESEVVVVGAGPTGLMAALLLQQCGISCRIMDKNPQAVHESRAFAVHAKTLELFQNLGLVERFIEAGLLALGMQIYVDGHQAAQLDLSDIGTEASPYAFILMLPQSEIEKILSEEVQKRGVVIEYGTEVLHFKQEDHGVMVYARNPSGQEEEIKTSYLIGADGAHSIVRKVLGLNFEGGAYRQHFMLADCKVEWSLDHSFGKAFMSGPALALYLPLKGSELSRIISIRRDEGPELKEGDDFQALTLAEVEKAFREAAEIPLKLSNAKWLARYRIHHRGVDQYSEGSVFVAGDAAHIHSPVGGQGMNTGLQDVANLVWKLAVVIKGGGPKELLESYHDERWPIGQKLLHFTDRIFSLVATTNPVATMFRNILFPLMLKVVSNIKACRFRLFRFISQLGIRYHQNPFLLDDIPPGPHAFPASTEPGRRAPNGLIKHNLDLFTLLSGYQFHLLALSKKALSNEDIQRISTALARLPKHLGQALQIHFIAHCLNGENKAVLQAESNQVFVNYGLSAKAEQGLFLIRPDGYIAYRTDSLEVDSLLTFCSLFSRR